MLPTVGRLGLPYIAMHKRGNPRTMDARCDYPGGVVEELTAYFQAFERRAEAYGIHEWILDPGLGFAKTPEQNWEILRRLGELKAFGRPVLVGAADKRFTHTPPPFAFPALPDETPTGRRRRAPRLGRLPGRCRYRRRYSSRMTGVSSVAGMMDLMARITTFSRDSWM